MSTDSCLNRYRLGYDLLLLILSGCFFQEAKED